LRHFDALRNRGIPAYSVGLLLMAVCCHAQIGIDSGQITGTVSDPQGAKLAGAAVTVHQAERGLSRTAVTNTEGEYRFASLPPALYEVEMEAAGFAIRTIPDVELQIGETRRVDAQMQLPELSFQVAVTAPAPVLDYERTQQAAVLSSAQIERLPINRRNYLDFALLVPGVVETTEIADQLDFRVPLTPNSGLGISGSGGRGNSVSIDGLSIDGHSQNVRPSVPQVSIQEFQVNRNTYSAQYGGASGGTINIVSKSGSNDFHITLFSFFRHSAIQARNFFDPGKASFTRHQSGAEISAPLKKDRTFLFGGFERLDRHEAVFVPILQDPSVLDRLTPSQQQLVDFFNSTGNGDLIGLGQTMKAVLTPSSNPTVRPLLERNSGVFPFGSAITQGSLRLDHRLTGKQDLFLRANITRDQTDNTKFGGLAGVSNGNRSHWADETFAFGYTWTPSPTWVNVTRAAFSRTRFRITPNDLFGPELVIGGISSLGRNSLYPFDQNETYVELQQSLAHTTARHSLRVGVDFRPARYSADVETFFSGKFVFGEYIPLAALLDQVGGAGFSSRLGGSLTALGRPDLAANLSQPVSSLQAFSLGLPVAYVQGFGATGYKAWRQNHSAFVDDSWRVRPGLVIDLGIRYQYDHPADMRTTHNFAPRVGFAWSPIAKDSFVIRGGYGLFQQFVMAPISFGERQIKRPDVTLFFLPITGIPGLNNPQTGLPVTSVDVYQTLLAQGVIGNRQIRFQDLAAFGFGPGFRFPTSGGAQQDYTNPYSHQFSLQLERAFGEWAVGVGYEFTRGAHLWRVRDRNLIQTGTQANGWPIFGRADPNFANLLYYESAANSFYSAVVMQVNRRFRSHISVNAHYTVSRTLDEVTDFTLEYQPHNQLYPRGDRGLSPYHQKHRVVAQAVFESPWGQQARTWRDVAVRNWNFAPIVRYNSAKPFNVLTGFDNVGDGQTTNHRPLGLGRDVGIGPDMFSIDFRLSRRFPVSEKFSVEILAEAFNALNRTNFLSVNNVVGGTPIGALPNPLIAVPGNPTTPLSYTAAGPPRQLQFGLRLAF